MIRALAILVLILTATAWWLWPQEDRAAVLVLQAETAPDLLAEHAVLTSAERTVVRTAIEGSIVSIIATGTHVDTGDVLAVIDPEDLEQRIDQLSLEREEAEATLQQHRLQLELTTAEIANEQTINDAELAYQEFRLQEQRDGLDETDERLLAIEEELARLDLAEAQQAYDRSQRLVERGLQSRSRLAEAERRLTRQRSRLEELRIEHRIRAAGPTLTELATMQADLARAQGRVQRATEDRKRKIASIEQDIAIEQATIAKIERELANAEADRELATLTAPRAGIAMPKRYRDWRSGGRIVEVGPGVKRWPGDALVDVVDPDRMQAEIMINEVDFARLEAGMPVTLVLAAYPDLHFEGRIDFLAGIGRDRGEIASNQQEGPGTGVSVFSATISFAVASDVDLRPGMTGTAFIELPTSGERLVIPSALATAGDEPDEVLVWRLGAAGAEPVTVQVQPYLGGTLLVRDGLQAGDRLLWEPPR